MKTKEIKVYRNIPFVDTKGLGFYFQKYNERYWIEIPFVGITFKLK